MSKALVKNRVNRQIAQILKRLKYHEPCQCAFVENPNSDEKAPLKVFPDFHDFNDGIPNICSCPTYTEVKEWLLTKGVFLDITPVRDPNPRSDAWKFKVINLIHGIEVDYNLESIKTYHQALLLGVHEIVTTLDELRQEHENKV